MIDNARLKPASTAGLERLLDVAGNLLLQTGYQRVIPEEVARRARVAPAALYARFPTKESLFLTVLLRAHRLGVDDQVRRMRTDPAALLPSRMVRAHYLSVIGDPVLAALYSRDAGVLGRLVVEAGETLATLVAARRAVLIDQLTVLRGLGCVRTERTPETQFHALMAIFHGWFLADEMSTLPPGDLLRADLLAETVTAALEVGDPPLAAIAREQQRLADRYASLSDMIDREWRRRVG